MDFEPSEHEPDENDLYDPDADGITVPEVSTAETDVPSAVAKAFWATVLVVNAAVLLFSLGVLFLLFTTDQSTALALITGGTLLFGFAYRRYRNFKRSRDAAPAASTDDETDTDTQ